MKKTMEFWMKQQMNSMAFKLMNPAAKTGDQRFFLLATWRRPLAKA
jgi:hypothetical protein